MIAATLYLLNAKGIPESLHLSGTSFILDLRWPILPRKFHNCYRVLFFWVSCWTLMELIDTLIMATYIVMLYFCIMKSLKCDTT